MSWAVWVRLRERAVRWNLVPCPGPTPPASAPDLGLDYHGPGHPDLILFTDLIDPCTAAEEVVRLAERLERAARRRRVPCA